MAKRKGMKYSQCRGCSWWYNGECIRPKGEMCEGRLVTNYKRRLCANNLNGTCQRYLRKCRPQGCPWKTDKVEYPIKEIKDKK